MPLSGRLFIRPCLRFMRIQSGLGGALLCTGLILMLVRSRSALKKIGKIFDKYNPSVPYGYRFADEAYNSSFQLESLVGLLAGIFAGLAIFISCSGVYLAFRPMWRSKRKKEIGVYAKCWVHPCRRFGPCYRMIFSCSLASAACNCVTPSLLYFLNRWLQN